MPIASVGMACAVGSSALAACAAIRAHVSRFEQVPFHDDQNEPVVAAPALEIVQGRQGHERLGALLCRALADCIGGDDAAVAQALHAVPCLIIVDHQDRPDYPALLGAHLLSELRTTFGAQLHAETRFAAMGVAGFFKALSYAPTLIDRWGSCLVAAVDSLINRDMLAALEATQRLKTSGNSDGVIPGEAAAALWLGRPHAPRPTLAHVLGVGLADEPSASQTDQPNKGLGLAEAMRQALAEAGLPLHEIDFRVAGLIGERLGFVEASTALARVQKVHKDRFELWAPAEQIGDVGAALPACLTVAATMGFAKGYAPGSRAIIMSLSDREKRAACILSKPEA